MGSAIRITKSVGGEGFGGLRWFGVGVEIVRGQAIAVIVRGSGDVDGRRGRDEEEEVGGNVVDLHDDDDDDG